MMDLEETRRLLAACASIDNRKPNPEAIGAWATIAQQSGWTLAEALTAVARHYAGTRDWIMPADITRIIRDLRVEARQALPWCGECDDSQNRQVPVQEDGHERWAPCPRCHRSRVTTAAPALPRPSMRVLPG